VRDQAVVGGVVVGYEVCLDIGGRGRPGTLGCEEGRVRGDVRPASGGVWEVTDAHLELAGGRDAELEVVRAKEASGGVVDVRQHVGKRAPALLGSFEIGVEDVLASVG
jgi:hypothetical protein